VVFATRDSSSVLQFARGTQAAVLVIVGIIRLVVGLKLFGSHANQTVVFLLVEDRPENQFIALSVKANDMEIMLRVITKRQRGSSWNQDRPFRLRSNHQMVVRIKSALAVLSLPT
jgi:hypothetical protein